MTYDKTGMNIFVQNLYDQKMQEGKHGHYESMFHVVHKAIERALSQPMSMEPVAWRWSETNGDRWFNWTTDWYHHHKAEKLGFPIEYAYPQDQLAAARQQGAEEERKKLADRERMLTDKELADTVYMKAYIQEGNDTISYLLTANKRDKEARQQRIAELEEENKMLRRADEDRQKCMVKMQADAVKYEDDIANLRTVMMAAAVEIAEHWDGHNELMNAYIEACADAAIRADRIADLEKSNAGLLSALKYALDWVDAVPNGTPLPAMPGFDRDWVDSVIAIAEVKP